MILRTKLARVSALVAVLILLCGCQPNQDVKSITDINDRISGGIAALANLERIHHSPVCEAALIEWKGGADDEKIVWVTVDPSQDPFYADVEVCLSQHDPQTAKLKITNYTVTDYYFDLPPEVQAFPGTIPSSDDTLRRFASDVQSEVRYDTFNNLVPSSAAHLTIPVRYIKAEGEGPHWTMTLRANPAVGQIVTMTFVTGQALGLIDPKVGVAQGIHDCVVESINNLGRSSISYKRSAENARDVAFECLSLAPNFARGSKAADYIEWAKDQGPDLLKAWESLGVFKPHPDVSITLTKSGSLPPVQLNPHDPALGNPAQPLQQKRQQKKKAPPPIEERKELVDPKIGFDPTSGRPGSTPNLFGGGFYPNKDITITESSPAGSRPVGVIAPDASGSFDIMFQIPDSTPAGQITYTFRQEPNLEVADTFLVGGEPVSTPEPVPTPEEAAPTPEEAAPTPEEAAPTPEEAAPTPEEAAPTPEEAAPTG
jgi:hypothetical protein